MQEPRRHHGVACQRWAMGGPPSSRALFVDYTCGFTVIRIGAWLQFKIFVYSKRPPGLKAANRIEDTLPVSSKNQKNHWIRSLKQMLEDKRGIEYNFAGKNNGVFLWPGWVNRVKDALPHQDALVHPLQKLERNKILCRLALKTTKMQSQASMDKPDFSRR